MIVFLDIFAVIGIVWILSSSKICKPFREWLTNKYKFLGELLSCWGCLAFWIAIIYYPLPYKEILRFIFISVLIAIFLQLFYNKLK